MTINIMNPATEDGRDRQVSIILFKVTKRWQTQCQRGYRLVVEAMVELWLLLLFVWLEEEDDHHKSSECRENKENKPRGCTTWETVYCVSQLAPKWNNNLTHQHNSTCKLKVATQTVYIIAVIHPARLNYLFLYLSSFSLISKVNSQNTFPFSAHPILFLLSLHLLLAVYRIFLGGGSL